MNPPRKQYKMVKRVIQIHCGLKMAIYKFILIFALFVTITDGSSKFYYIQLIVNSVFTTLLFRISKINKEKKTQNASNAEISGCFFYQPCSGLIQVMYLSDCKNNYLVYFWYYALLSVLIDMRLHSHCLPLNSL